MKRALELSLAITLALGAGHALAVGLGQIQVKSRLNQPLVAEIPVSVDRGGDAETLAVGLASAEEFSRIGIERSQIGVPLEFTLVKGAGGQAVVRITSKEPVRAPFLDFLVAANWSNGRVLREYTVLLDPPTTAPAVSAAVEPMQVEPRPMTAPPPPPEPASTAAVVEEPAPEATAIEPASTEPARAEQAANPVVDLRSPDVVAEPSTSETVATPPSEEAESARPTPATPTKSLPPSVAASNGTNYGPVAAGETLWEIAQATLPDDGVSANQLMLALLNANPQAFSKGNINRLKRGAILRIPSPEEIRAVGSMREAAAQVRTQIDQWRSETTAPTLLAGTAAGTVSAPDFSNATSGPVGEDRLALVPPEMGKDGLASIGQAGSSAGTSDGNASAAELARNNEELESRTQEAGELRSRVQDLEKIQNSNERLISLKDSEIADLQRKLADAQAAAASTPEATAETAIAAVPEPVVTTESTQTPPVDTAEPAAASEPDAAPKDDIWGNSAATSAVAAETDAATANPDGAIDPLAADTGTPDGSAAPDSAAEPASADVNPDVVPLDSSPVVDPSSVEPTALETADTAPTPASAEQVADRPWYLDPRVLGGGALVLLLLGVLAMRSRRKTPVATTRSSLADQFAATTTATPVVVASAAGVSSVMDEERQLAEQIADNPSDLGARLELISIYYADNRVDEFRAAALAMEPYIDDPKEPEWVQVRAMAEDLFPNESMFGPAVVAAASAVSAADREQWESAGETDDEETARWSDDISDIDEIGDAEPDVVVEAPVVAATDNELRFAPTPQVEVEDALEDIVEEDDAVEMTDDLDELDAKASGGLTFTLEDAPELDAILVDSAVVTPLSDRPALKGRPLTEMTDDPRPSGDSFDFDLPPLDFESSFTNENKSAVMDSSDDEDAANDDDGTDAVAVSDLDDEFLVGEDALGTKLDLARAYVDMGDPDGARGMLEEVISAGDSQQKEKARRLLAELD